MNGSFGLKLILIFSIALSLVALNGPMSSIFQLPQVRVAHATPDRCDVVGSSGACSQFWYPAGAEMNTITTPIFTDETAEYTDLQSASPTIDLTDWQCSGTPTGGTCGALQASTSFRLTAPVAQAGYYELQFHLDNNYWNCNFNFGNSQCGVDIRQAIAHMFDKISFCQNSVVAGVCSPLDNPVPTSSGGGLPSPNPCSYDPWFPQTGPNCVVGTPGGSAYHLSNAAGANGSPWLYAPGSLDLNAAAQHLVNAGVATSFNSTTSALTNPVTTNTPTIFIRSDSAPRKQLGESIASQICYLFTRSYLQPCAPYLNTVEGPIDSFCPPFTVCCFTTTCCTTVCPSWYMYTSAFGDVPFFDSTLYYTFNSRFVSGIPSIQQPTGPCSPQSVPTASPGDYMYLCSPNYDNLSSQMEFSPCLTSPQDPMTGQPNNGPGGHCTIDPTKLSAISAGIQAEAIFGAGAFTIPLFETTTQFAYLNNGWTRVINHSQLGLPNQFTWLNAYNPTAPSAWTIRQAFKETTRSVNPFVASTLWDGYIDGNIYDTLSVTNPLSPTQLINWMTYTVIPQTNATVRASSGYEPPPGTTLTYHFTLRNDVYFQDGRPVTSYDVAFSYLSMIDTGAFSGVGATGMTGITVLTPRSFDIAMGSVGPFTLGNLVLVFIVPGRYWTGAGASTWDNDLSNCIGITPCAKSQYALSGSTVTCPSGVHPGCASFPASAMQIDPNKTVATYDPIANGILIGSGAFECKSGTGVVGMGCSSTGAQNPPQPGGSYTLTRFGAGLAPASSTSGIYFRSSGNLALDIWTEENDINPIAAVSAASICFNQPVNPTGVCAHWQNGIGASTNGIVGITQVSMVELRYNLNWISPFEWQTNPPLGIGTFSPVLSEGPTTLNPCSIDPAKGYDC